MPLLNHEKRLRVFLSHAQEDKLAVRSVCDLLSANGYDPWLDEERLLPGQDWHLEIKRALRESDAVIVFLSEYSVAKEGYVQRELRLQKQTIES